MCYSTRASAYLVACHCGMHRDTRDWAPEWIAERYSGHISSPADLAEARAGLKGSQGRTVLPEFNHRLRLRACRDVAHMCWSHVAHYTPWVSAEQQILGAAGGGVVKYVGS